MDNAYHRCSYKEDMIQVQRVVNHLQLVSTCIGVAPAVVYSLFVGALSERTGFKPLMIFPVAGLMLQAMVREEH